ncbi:MAG: hypothetical protein ACTSUE_06495 [Promethearchaeota archaeon]
MQSVPKKKQQPIKFTHDEILAEASKDPSNFVVVLGESDPKNVPWFVYVVMHAQKAKRFKCRTHVGRAKNPFRKEMEHNLKALKRCKVTRPAAGFWKLCMVVGPYMTESEAEEAVREWRKTKRAEYGRHANGMKLCENSQGKLLCFSDLVTEDIAIDQLKKLPQEHFTPFKSFPLSNAEVQSIIDSNYSGKVPQLVQETKPEKRKTTTTSCSTMDNPLNNNVKRQRSGAKPNSFTKQNHYSVNE